FPVASPFWAAGWDKTRPFAPPFHLHPCAQPVGIGTKLDEPHSIPPPAPATCHGTRIQVEARCPVGLYGPTRGPKAVYLSAYLVRIDLQQKPHDCPRYRQSH